MELEIRESSRTDKGVVLVVTGRLNAASAPELKSRIKQQVTAGRIELVLDLGGVSIIDSSGLAALVSGLKMAREANGWLKLAGMNDQVASIFKMTLLDRVFEMYPNVEAVKH